MDIRGTNDGTGRRLVYGGISIFLRLESCIDTGMVERGAGRVLGTKVQFDRSLYRSLARNTGHISRLLKASLASKLTISQP